MSGYVATCVAAVVGASVTAGGVVLATVAGKVESGNVSAVDFEELSLLQAARAVAATSTMPRLSRARSDEGERIAKVWHPGRS
ncbi:unannotated protein [freshwater metagenome]|uniref:Unannotated protein n=1 Tax=freshwater metagenome TaxID=449393 RepID=A0A6J6A2Z7_9ZZZZ